MSRYQRTILGTCCVPWNEDATLAEDLFRESIRYLLDRGLCDLYVFGTAGEGYAVSDALFDQVVRVFVEQVTDGGGVPMVGVISLSLPTIIERIERAAALGVREFQLSLPSWGALSDQELPVFFREVCSRFPEIQFLHYNVPRAGRLVTAAEYAALAAAHPNLVATKQVGTDLRYLSELFATASDLRHFVTDPGYAYASIIGEPGLLMAISATNPLRAREYFEAGVRRDVDVLMSLHRDLTGIRTALIAAVGSEAHMDGARDKIHCKLHEPRFPLRLLPPYQGASDDAFERYRAAIRARYPRWLED
ncbi:MAG: dihydrodipicolinate synthase family protein [Chloroflexi bacterium]|nr:dihydrodipicolinate synthase family protein [Chloroflexota bacterium]